MLVVMVEAEKSNVGEDCGLEVVNVVRVCVCVCVCMCVFKIRTPRLVT